MGMARSTTDRPRGWLSLSALLMFMLPALGGPLEVVAVKPQLRQKEQARLHLCGLSGELLHAGQVAVRIRDVNRHLGEGNSV